MNPATICSGFRRCGVYPFNPDAIDCTVSVSNPVASLQQVNDKETKGQDDNASDQQQTNVVPSEKAALFQRRFEEGYDLPDDEYMKWLCETHPESVMNQTAPTVNNITLDKTSNSGQIPSEKLILFQRRYEEGYDLPDEEYMKWLCEKHPETVAECFVGSNGDNETSPLSIAGALCDIPVASPVTIVSSESLMEADHDVRNDEPSKVIEPYDNATAKLPQLEEDTEPSKAMETYDNLTSKVPQLEEDSESATVTTTIHQKTHLQW